MAKDEALNLRGRARGCAELAVQSSAEGYLYPQNRSSTVLFRLHLQHVQQSHQRQGRQLVKKAPTWVSGPRYEQNLAGNAGSRWRELFQPGTPVHASCGFCGSSPGVQSLHSEHSSKARTKQYMKA